MPETETITPGGSERPAMVSASRRVPSLRLSMMRLFFAGVQWPSPTLSAARCTTASNPPRREGSRTPEAGSQRIVSSEEGFERLSRITRCPSPSSSGIRADPMNPVAPLTRTFMIFLHKPIVCFVHMVTPALPQDRMSSPTYTPTLAPFNHKTRSPLLDKDPVFCGTIHVDGIRMLSGCTANEVLS